MKPIVIEKKQRREKTRTMVEIDNEIHRQLLKLSLDTNQSMRDLVSMLLKEALQYVEVGEGK